MWLRFAILRLKDASTSLFKFAFPPSVESNPHTSGCIDVAWKWQKPFRSGTNGVHRGLKRRLAWEQKMIYLKLIKADFYNWIENPCSSAELRAAAVLSISNARFTCTLTPQIKPLKKKDWLKCFLQLNHTTGRWMWTCLDLPSSENIKFSKQFRPKGYYYVTNQPRLELSSIST